MSNVTKLRTFLESSSGRVKVKKNAVYVDGVHAANIFGSRSASKWGPQGSFGLEVADHQEAPMILSKANSGFVYHADVVKWTREHPDEILAAWKTAEAAKPTPVKAAVLSAEIKGSAVVIDGIEVAEIVGATASVNHMTGVWSGGFQVFLKVGPKIAINPDSFSRYSNATYWVRGHPTEILAAWKAAQST